LATFFFKGHPRQRGGVEETQKLYLVYLPLIIIGAILMKREFLSLWISFGVLYLVILAAFSLRDSSYSLPLLIPLAIFASEGVSKLIKGKKRVALVLVVSLLLAESTIFLYSYFSGFEESQFSPRRPVYRELVPKISGLVRNKKKVFVTERLGNPEIFFSFYLGNIELDNYEFSDVNFKENPDTKALYVSVLPDNPSPADPLYKAEGMWPQEIEVLYEVYENHRRQTIVVFNLK
jgi:hypothetical protein